MFNELYLVVVPATVVITIAVSKLKRRMMRMLKEVSCIRFGIEIRFK